MNVQPKSNNVNFTSVLQTRVFIDGQQALRPKNIKMGIRGLESILTNPSFDEKSLRIKKKFAEHVKDLNYFGGKVDIGEVIRNFVDPKGVLAYLFTGIHTTKLNEVGKKIGPEKRFSLESKGTTKSYEVGGKVRAYYELINKFISYKNARVKEFINPRDGTYAGEELMLNIYAKSSGKVGKKDFKLTFEDIYFSKDTEVKQTLPEKQAKNTLPKASGKRKPKEVKKNNNAQLKIDFNKDA